jgi:nicotinamide mononucleotide transporter
MLETAFILLGTPVTWLEVLAFVLALANIVFNVAEIHWGWPLSIVASVLYAWLFYASKLYGEASVNLFFAAAAVWGWWQWLRGHRADSSESLHIARLDDRGRRLVVVAWIASWGLCSALLCLITDSDVWWADGFVTAGSVVGTVLLGRKFIENWPVWLIVNGASIALFLYKDLALTAILYVVFLGLAVWGWMGWNERHTRQIQKIYRHE